MQPGGGLRRSKAVLTGYRASGNLTNMDRSPRRRDPQSMFKKPAAGHANQHFAFHFRHPEKVSQPVEVGRDRHGFELGGHVVEVAGDVKHFLRHSPKILIVGSSRRSRGSAL
jgi:hypothetical protein